MSAGDRIRAKREELGLTQEELAFKLGYKSRSSVNKVELSRDLSLKIVTQYAEVLGCSAAYLLGWEDNAEENNRELSSEMAEIDVNVLSKFHSLTLEEQNNVVAYMDFIIAQRNK